MKTSKLDYQLPEKLIAQEPIEPRDASRLLVLNRKKGSIAHKDFRDIDDYLEPGDLLVVNDTKVLPARLSGHKIDTGANVEILLLAERRDNEWEILAKPAKRLKVGTIIDFDSELKAEVIALLENGRRLLRFDSKESLLSIFERIGKMPLPPYITEPLVKPDRYQTIYAKKQESAAAPTAGLHFTKDLISELKNKGIGFGRVSLRIGLDTFQPIREKEVEKHRIHSEHFELSKETANALNKTREAGNRIIAVGTTSARVLESAAINRVFNEENRPTDLFIYPGYNFRAVDAMITNFHLPKSTLLAMVSAFASLELIKKAYEEAIQKRYRFFSFGDAMLII